MLAPATSDHERAGSMSATITGAYDGRVYQVDLDLSGDGTALPEDMDPGIRAALEARAGETLSVSMAGPVTSLDLADPASVLIGLLAFTSVTHVTPDAAALLPLGEPDRPGVVQ